MRTLLISYDLGIPETRQDYEKIREYMDGFSYWVKPLKSQWIVKTSKSTDTILAEVEDITDSNDKILVIDITGTAATWTENIGSEISQWMQNNI